jgi:hypothetical protein
MADVEEGGRVVKKQHGVGKFTMSDGTVIKGRFDHGQLVDGTLTNEDEEYTGQFKNNRIEGQGKRVFRDGSFEVGLF